MVQDIPNGGSNGDDGVPFMLGVAKGRSKINPNLRADGVRERQDLLMVIALALDDELRSVGTIEGNHENPLVCNTITLNCVVPDLKFSNAAFLQ
jgi:hypothetical protein